MGTFFLVIFSVAIFLSGLTVLLLGLAAWDIVFTKRLQNHAKMVVKGDTFVRIITPSTHVVLDTPERVARYNAAHPEGRELYKKNEKMGYEQWDVVPRPQKGEVMDGEWPVSLIEKFLGLAFIGVPLVHKIYRYKFTWASPVLEEGESEESMKKHPDIYLSSILVDVDKTYIIMVKSAENEDKIPFDFRLLYTWRCINPYKALFGVGNWLQTIASMFQEETRRFIANRKLDEVFQLTGKGKNDELQIFFRPVLSEITKRYGIFNVDVGIAEVSPSDNSAMRYLRAGSEVKVAKQEADAKKQWAEGESAAAEAKAKGESSAINQMATAIEDHGFAGILAAGLQTIRDIKGQTRPPQSPTRMERQREEREQRRETTTVRTEQTQTGGETV